MCGCEYECDTGRLVIMKCEGGMGQGDLGLGGWCWGWREVKGEDSCLGGWVSVNYRLGGKDIRRTGRKC